MRSRSARGATRCIVAIQIANRPLGKTPQEGVLAMKEAIEEERRMVACSSGSRKLSMWGLAAVVEEYYVSPEENV
jgi:protein tyrosine phosphatase (PTP) superfamily phosphohydrolase (DUF442 family)